jgi:LuxR family maltose regulon positive regulatory protein
MMFTSLLTTKLFVPPVRRELVPRLRLIARLDAGLAAGRKLTLIAAPAGYGKTTLVAGWLRGSSAPIAWLSLDENDNDPARFAAYLLAALQQIDPAIGQTAQMMLQTPGPPAMEAFLTSLINDIAATPAAFILALDDLHLIQAPLVHRLLAFLLEHAPPQLHLVLITREDPPLPLARPRGQGQITDIRQNDLKFTDEETAAFLQQTMALDLPAADVATLQERTEGWIAGLQLAALSMQGSADARRFVADFAGSDRYILDYLVEEVYQRQPPEVQDFLLKTSVLDRMCAGLCDAVTKIDESANQRIDDSPFAHSQEILEHLERANLFVVRLDEARQWHRYHRLFRDLLRTQRKGLDLAVLHHRAAGWFEQNDFPDEALDHLLAADDWDGAERLLRLAAPQAINNGQFATLNRWLDALPEARLTSNPELAAVKGWALLSLGQFAAAGSWAAIAEGLLRPDTPPEPQALVLCLQTYLAQIRSDIPQVIELAQRVLALLEGGDPHGLRGAALSNLASAQMILGDIPAATRTLRELARVGQEGGHLISAVTALGSLAGLEHMQGQAHEAITLCHQALDLCAQSAKARGAPSPSPLAGYAHSELGLITYDLDELARSRAHLVQGIELSNQLRPSPVTIQAAFALARIQHLMGETEASLATVEAERRAVAALNTPSVDALAAAYEADFRLMLGDVAAAARWAEKMGLSPADTPVFAREFDYVTYSRLLLAQGRPADARTLLTSLERYARNNGLAGSLITIDVLQAQAQQALGQKAEALACLAEAVRLAAPEGYRSAFMRAFLDGGVTSRPSAVAALLPGVRHVAPAFVDGLLDRRPVPDRSRPAAVTQPMVEPLSERELEVLRLVADGLSNSEIAARLFVSTGTVKTHVHNILGKLDADGRPRAIARARELELIPK